MRNRDSIKFWIACLAAIVSLIAVPSDASAALWGKKKAKEPAALSEPAPAAPAAAAPVEAAATAPAAAAPQTSMSELEAENARLKEQMKQLEADRDNVLAQTRILLGEKSKYQESQEALGKQQKELLEAKTRGDSLTAEKAKLEQELASTVASYDNLKKEHESVTAKNENLALENEQLGLALFQRLENDPQVKRMMEDLKTERENTRKHADARKTLEAELKKSSGQLKQSAEREAKLAQELAAAKAKLELTEAERNNLLDTVREQENSLGKAPERFKTLAQENRMLIKESSEMHYNMGVFFTEKKQYDQAINEYERALEFDPDNAKVYYNLGYLYSEGFKNHEQAVYQFKEYLKLEPQSPLSEQLRSYILSRETQSRKVGDRKWEERASDFTFRRKGDAKPSKQ